MTDHELNHVASLYQRLKYHFVVAKYGYKPTREHGPGLGGPKIGNREARWALGADGKLRRLYYSISVLPKRHFEDEGMEFRWPTFWEFLTAYSPESAFFYLGTCVL